MDQDKKLEAADRALADALGKIEGELQEIVSHYGSLLDPDATLDRLDAHAGRLCEAIGRVTESIPDPSDACPTDLNLVLQDCVARSVETAGFPVVVNTSLANGLPLLDVAPMSVSSALDRTLDVSLRFAGHGGELRIATRQESDEIIVRLDVLSSGQLEAAADECAPRLESVREFMNELGGGFEFEADCDVAFAVALRLPVGVGIA